jgi:hypothetical protein
MATAATNLAQITALQAQIATLTSELTSVKGNHTALVNYVDNGDYGKANVRDINISWLVICGKCFLTIPRISPFCTRRADDALMSAQCSLLLA